VSWLVTRCHATVMTHLYVFNNNKKKWVVTIYVHVKQ